MKEIFTNFRALTLILAASMAGCQSAPTGESRVREVRAMLDQTRLDLDLTDATLEDFIEFIHAHSTIHIILDREIDPTTFEKVSFRTRDLSLANALRLILAQYSLDYAVWDGGVIITTRAKIPSEPYRGPPYRPFVHLWSDPDDRVNRGRLNRERIDIDVANVPLADALETVRNTARINIHVSKRVDQEMLERRVSLSERSLLLRDVFQRLLQPNGLTYLFRDGVVFVTMAEEPETRIERFPRYVENTLEGRAFVEQLSISRVTLDFEETPLPAIVDFMRDLLQTNILIDTLAIEHPEEIRASLRVTELHFGSALHLLTESCDLEIYVIDGHIKITSKERT